MKIEEAKLFHQLDDVLKGEGVICETKLFELVKNAYLSVDEHIPDDKLMYQVYRVKQEGCDLLHALTILYPLTVNGECNMTKGHYHKDASMGEFYYCKKGHGLMLLQNRNGDCQIQEMSPGSAHLVPGEYAHRCVNIAENENLEFACVWSEKAEYDYEAIEKHPFSYRVFLKNGKVEIK